MKMGGHFYEMTGKCQVPDCYHKHCKRGSTSGIPCSWMHVRDLRQGPRARSRNEGRERHNIYEDHPNPSLGPCISDASGAGRVRVWGSHVGTMVVGDSYLLSEFIVKEFRGNKYLSMRKEGSNIEKIDDVGAVMNVDEGRQWPALKIYFPQCL